MVARSLLIAGVASLLFASPALASTATAARPDPACRRRRVRIAATTATFNAIEAKIAAGQSLRLRFPDPTAQEDIIDYGVNGLWQKGIDGAGVTVAYVVTNPDPGLEASMTNYDTAMDLPPANITDMALPGAGQPDRGLPDRVQHRRGPARRGGDPLDGAVREHPLRPPAGTGDHRHAGLATGSPGHRR